MYFKSYDNDGIVIVSCDVLTRESHGWTEVVAQHQVIVEWPWFFFGYTSGSVKKYMAIMTTRRHAEISDLSPKKVSPDPPQNIRHAATALTGVGCSVAATIGTFLFPPRRQKSATSIEPCHIIRYTGDHEAHSLRTFVAALRQFLRHWPKKVSQ